MTIDQARYGPFGDEFGPAWEMSTRRLRMRSAPAEAHPVGSGDANVVAGSVRAAWPVAAAMRPGQCLRRQKGAYRFAAWCVSLCGAVSERGRRLCLSGYECLCGLSKRFGGLQLLDLEILSQSDRAPSLCVASTERSFDPVSKYKERSTNVKRGLSVMRVMAFLVSRASYTQSTVRTQPGSNRNSHMLACKRRRGPSPLPSISRTN